MAEYDSNNTSDTYSEQDAYSTNPTAIVNQALVNYDFSIDAAEPAFTDGGIFVSDIWYKGNNTVWGNCNYYSYKHSGRYLKLLLAVKADSGGTALLRIMDNAVQLWSYSSTSNDLYGETITVTIDLGEPTGMLKNFYLNLSTGNVAQYAYVRVMRKWLEG